MRGWIENEEREIERGGGEEMRGKIENEERSTEEEKVQHDRIY